MYSIIIVTSYQLITLTVSLCFNRNSKIYLNELRTNSFASVVNGFTCTWCDLDNSDLMRVSLHSRNRYYLSNLYNLEVPPWLSG
jgi:hypothetical protein